VVPRHLLLDRGAAHERQGCQDDQPGQRGGRADECRPAQRTLGQRAQPRPGQVGAQTEQTRDADRHQRRRLLRRAHEGDDRDVAIDPDHRRPRRRPVREAGDLDRGAGQQHEQQERRVGQAPRPHEAGDGQGRNQQRRPDHQWVEEQRARLREQRRVEAVEPDTDVGRPVAHQAQRLRGVPGRPDRAGLLREAQEVDAVSRVDEERDDPPQRRERPEQPHAQQEAGRVAPAHRPDDGLVEQQEQRADEHPAHDRAVDAASERGEDERERRRPPPAAPAAAPPAHGPHAVEHDEQQPGQRGVADERRGRAAREDDGVGVEEVERRRDDVRDAARAADEDVEEAQDAPRRQGEDHRQPQPGDDPG
jgi:hypothetical protein